MKGTVANRTEHGFTAENTVAKSRQDYRKTTRPQKDCGLREEYKTIAQTQIAVAQLRSPNKALAPVHHEHVSQAETFHMARV